MRAAILLVMLTGCITVRGNQSAVGNNNKQTINEYSVVTCGDNCGKKLWLAASIAATVASGAVYAYQTHQEKQAGIAIAENCMAPANNFVTQIKCDNYYSQLESLQQSTRISSGFLIASSVSVGLSTFSFTF